MIVAVAFECPVAPATSSIPPPVPLPRVSFCATATASFFERLDQLFMLCCISGKAVLYGKLGLAADWSTARKA